LKGPFFVDFDEDGRCEAQERCLAWEDADFDGSALEFLLDTALHGVGGSHSAAMVLGQSEDGEAFGDIVLEPCGQFWRGFTVAGDQGDQFGLCLVGGIGVPDRSQLRADPFTGGRIGRVMDRVLRQVCRFPLRSDPVFPSRIDPGDGMSRRAGFGSSW